jgi:hypothetical protein
MATVNVEIANDFFHDAGDLLDRYRLTADHFYAIKSKRMKLFLDLRMAAECILKAYAAYFLMVSVTRDEIIRRVEAYKHDIRRMSDDVKPMVDTEVWHSFEPFVDQLSALPVGLRYRLDGADFRRVNESFYYQTIGSDSWLDKLHDAIRVLNDSLNTLLVGHSRLLSAADLLEVMEKPRHNKYAKKRHND